MLVTEHEAKQKLCCQKLDVAAIEESRCDGSSCMAWRWANKTVHVDGKLQTIQVGFCGLAGRPE